MTRIYGKGTSIPEKIKLNAEVTDAEFDFVYPKEIRELGSLQWTPVAVAKMAAKYLAEKPGSKILDIGSGVGKFCTIGASCTNAHYTGIEQRLSFIDIANEIKEHFNLENISFVNANILDIAFAGFDAVYFFNSFYENLDRNAVIDSSIERGIDFYRLYTRYVCGQLEKMPVGTRLATYWSPQEIVSASYELQSSAFEDSLKFFRKIR